MHASPPALAISRDDAVAMLEQMDQMRARLYSAHPDLNVNRQQSMEYSFLPGSVDSAADPQTEAGQPSGSNPRTISRENSARRIDAPKNMLPIAEQPVLYHEVPQEGAAKFSGYQTTAAVSAATRDRPNEPALPEDGTHSLSESESRAIKALILSQLDAAHEAEAIREFIRTEVQKHTALRPSLGSGTKLPPLMGSPTISERNTLGERNSPQDNYPPDHPDPRVLVIGQSDKSLLGRTQSDRSTRVARCSSLSQADDIDEGDETKCDDHSNRTPSDASFRKKKDHPERRKRSMEAIDDHTGGIYPATAVSPGQKHKNYDDDTEDDGWESTAENAYGAFIHITLQSGLFAALYKCAPMLITSVLIQFIFAYELYRALPSVESSVTFCQIPWDLQMAAIGVFVTLMLDNISGMYDASRISLTSMLWKESEEKAEFQEIRCNMASRVVLWVLAVLTEITTWFGIFSSGVLFILTAESVDLVIRSTVAIMFVQNVDEIIFESCCSRQIKDSLRATRYKMVDPLGRMGIQKSHTETMDHVYSLFLHLPFILLITASIVLGLRAGPDIDCLHI